MLFSGADKNEKLRVLSQSVAKVLELRTVIKGTTCTVREAQYTLQVPQNNVN